MKARYYLLGCLALVGCDEAAQLETAEPVVVNFTQPFPATAPDLSGFLLRDCKRHYTRSYDASTQLVISEKALVKSCSELAALPGAWLDSAGVPRQPGSCWGRNGIRYYNVRKLAADSFQVRAERYDTLLNLSGHPAPRLRYHRGWYYISRPAPEDSTKWDVRRLGIRKGLAVWQLFNPDSLGIQALDPALVQRQKKNGQLIFTLAPQSRRAIWQVSSYDGLWIGEE